VVSRPKPEPARELRSGIGGLVRLSFGGEENNYWNDADHGRCFLLVPLQFVSPLPANLKPPDTTFRLPHLTPPSTLCLGEVEDQTRV